MTGPQQPYPGGQWPGGGDGQYSQPGSHGQPGQPGYPGAEQPPYDQYGQPATGQPYEQAYTQPGMDPYAQPGIDPYGQQPGYPPPGAPLTPVPKKSNATPWIIGGIAAGVVVLLICGIGAFFIFNSGGGGGGGLGGGGKYDASKISNLCDKVDSSPLKTALPAASDEDSNSNKHDEHRYSYSTSLSCSFGYKSPSESDSYASSSGSVTASFSKSTGDAKTSYESSKKYASGQTGSGHTYGEVSDIGDAAFYTADTSSSVTYNLYALSSNVVIQVYLYMYAGEGVTKPSTDTAKQAASTILKDALSKLGK